MSASIGVDIGGTKIAGVLVAESGDIVSRSVLPTPHTSAAQVVDTLAEVVVQLGDRTAPVGVAVAGRVSGADQLVLQSANLALAGVPLPGLVAERLGRRPVLLNDADAALLGEWWHGAAVGHRDVLMVTLGTGVGGACICGGRLIHGAHGAAGEIGHTTVKTGGQRCGCGSRGCLDRYASGRALARYGRRRRRGFVGNGADVTAAAERGEEWATEAVAELARWLAAGLANATALLDPGLVVLAGGLGTAGEVVRDPVARALERELAQRGVPARPDVVTGTLGPDAGAIGAASYAAGRMA